VPRGRTCQQASQGLARGLEEGQRPCVTAEISLRCLCQHLCVAPIAWCPLLG
jgi:hypothetical protein